jgi:hypothetical protein
MQQPAGAKWYFVDEAGDSTLFSARGVNIVGREGVSHCFIVGVAEIPDPAAARTALDALRQALLADPYFRGVPSMQPAARKTALCFHAKDDLPEVRREVFRLLPSLGVTVRAAVRRKDVLAARARELHARGQRLREADVYDHLVKILFRDLLHRGESNEVCFARRGKSDRQEALASALDDAKQNFRRRWNSLADPPVSIRASVPSADVGLQITDYYLWALQRLFERDEDRYFLSVADQFGLIIDLDDTRDKPHGRWYGSSDPLTREKKKPLTS